MDNSKENKPELGTVNGMQYEIGKLHEFSDTKDFNVSAFLILNSFAGEKFNADGFTWRFCREIKPSDLGKITPAAVDLVDGAAYEFTARGRTLNGIYEKHHNTLNIMVGQYFNLETCTNIIRLVPEAKS
jgi:hypothetical protein